MSLERIFMTNIADILGEFSRRIKSGQMLNPNPVSYCLYELHYTNYIIVVKDFLHFYIKTLLKVHLLNLIKISSFKSRNSKLHLKQ